MWDGLGFYHIFLEGFLVRTLSIPTPRVYRLTLIVCSHLPCTFRIGDCREGLLHKLTNLNNYVLIDLQWVIIPLRMLFSK